MKKRVLLKAASILILADHVPIGSGSTQQRFQPVTLRICIAVLVALSGQETQVVFLPGFSPQ